MMIMSGYLYGLKTFTVRVASSVLPFRFLLFTRKFCSQNSSSFHCRVDVTWGVKNYKRSWEYTPKAPNYMVATLDSLDEAPRPSCFPRCHEQRANEHEPFVLRLYAMIEHRHETTMLTYPFGPTTKKLKRTFARGGRDGSTRSLA